MRRLLVVLEVDARVDKATNHARVACEIRLLFIDKALFQIARAVDVLVEAARQYQ